MSQHRDPVVAEALRDLDVPDHGPDFWAALDAALGDHGSPERDASDTEPSADVLDLASSPAAQRCLADRRRTRALALAAAVAIAVAMVVGAAVFRPGAGDDPQRLDTADPSEDPETTEAPEPTVREESVDTTLPEPTTTDGPNTPPAMTPVQAQANASEWLARLVAGDLEGAYGLLDDTSRAEMSFEDFELLGAGLVEGAAAFAGEVISRSLLQVETAAGFVSVVTFSGDVEREGMVETDSYPVVLTATGVHFTLDGPQLELAFDVADASGVTLTSPLVMTVGDDVPEVWVWTVGGGVNVLDPVDGRGRVEIDVEATAGPGTHLVTLLAVQGDRIVARSHTVVVP